MCRTYINLIYRGLSAQEVLFYASMGTLLQSPDEVFANRVRTSPVAVDICQHVFGTDIMDMVEDVLSSNDVPNIGRAALGMSPQSIVDVSDASGNCTLWDLIRPPIQYTVMYTVAQNEVKLFRAGTNEAPTFIEPADVAKQGREVLAHRLPTPGLEVAGNKLLLVCHLAHIEFLSALTRLQDEDSTGDFSAKMPGAYPTE